MSFHLELCPNNMKNLVISQNHTPWKSALNRERYSRSGSLKACRPEAPEMPIALEGWQREDTSGLEADNNAGRWHKAHERMQHRVQADPSTTFWAGLDLKENRTLEKRLTDFSFISDSQNNPQKTWLPRSPCKSESLPSLSDGLRAQSFSSAARSPRTVHAPTHSDGKRKLFSRTSPHFWGGQPSVADAWNLKPGPHAALPNSMVPHPSTGQWLI